MTLSPRQSLGIFLLAAILSFAANYAQHRFQPVIEIDSGDYLEYDWSSLRSVLSNRRTFGYPLFLSFVRAVSRDPRAIPVAHWLALVLAAFIVLEGLAAAGMRRHVALSCAATLLMGREMLRFGPSVTADLVACASAISSAGCFLACLAPRSCRWGWCGFVALTFLSYQTRPAYLFLIPLWPIVGAGLDALLLRRGESWKLLSRRVALYAAATVIPFVLFSTLRWAAVGHWGLVSFGGYNLIGVVGQFLDHTSADSLPAELQPLANRMLERAAQVKNHEAPTSFPAMERMYNPTIWEAAVPAATELRGDDPVAVNADLSRLSAELLKQHRRQYAKWLVWNGIYAIKQVVLLTVTDPGTGLLAVIFLLWHAWSLWRGPRPGGDREPEVDLIQFRESHLLFWTALSFAAAKGLLVILVEPAIERYMTGAMPLLPAALAVFLAHDVEAGRHRPARDPKTKAIIRR